MKKIFSLLILSYLCIPVLLAQQQYYQWSVTAGSGAMTYNGDLSHTLRSAKINAPAYQLSIGRTISPSLALTLQGSYGHISANDRARDWSGNLQTDNLNFTRGLNFQTTIRNASLLLTYRLNNGQVLSKHAAVAPYVYAGIGITDFTVYGDLYGANGQRYYYWDDNTVRNLPQQPANEASAQVIGQDRKFETKLSGMATEQTYPTQVFTIPAGVGLQFRISDRLSANLQAGANFTNTGYLDDVNGSYRSEYTSPEQAYAANPTGIIRDKRGNEENDLYFAAFLSVGYHFNFNKKSFTPPVAYAGHTSAMATASALEKKTDEQENDTEQPEEEPVTPSSQTNSKALDTPPAPPRTQQPVTSTTEANRETSPPTRQTVDINLRILLEDGKMRVDTINQTLTEPVNLMGPQQQTTTVEELNKSANRQFSAEDTIPLKVPVRRIPDETARPGTATIQGVTDTALAEEVSKLRREIDSLKRTPNPSVPTRMQAQPEPATSSQEKQTDIPADQRQTQQNQRLQAQPNNTAEIAALRREVDLLRQELLRERNTPTRQAPPQVITRERVVTPNVGLGVQAGSGQYTEKEMEQLQNQLTSIQTQLDTLRTQNKVDADPAVDNRIDSLLNLVNRLQTMNAAPAGQANIRQNEAQKAEQDALIQSLQNQVAGLNESLKNMETNVAAGIDTLSLGVPYTALGNTVVYYNINDAQLKEADKQRLSILGRKLKAEPAVLLLVKGFTDQTGNADYNLKLSQKRAENVKNYFVTQLGVKPEQILINYFGQQKASASSSSAYDRRVELELFREN
ncbi:OmpA family protein [Rhodocytophaga aerolata]|uniref:OmpA family protein n=1 Tax=Rhodocytophaga aerolata TaxID=455078 RepID=A0ABT8R7J6_9BACT|nr:OmpA family protein [Rhodocytophaga aerolata]MDO1447656.1 OmpA family protein [Rhodocytophaga aerolata]